MSLPLFRPLLLTVAATSLVFFGGVIALSTQSPDADSALSVASPITQPQSTQPSPLAALTAAQANELAKQNAPDAILQATPELINYNGTVAYEVLLDSGATYVDANLGTVLNPVTDPVVTSDYRAEGFDDDYDDDDSKYKHKKHKKKKHDDEGYKDNERLIAKNYEQYEEDDYDD